MTTHDVERSEAYPTKAVEDFMKPGIKEALVPLASLNSAAARSISVKLESGGR